MQLLKEIDGASIQEKIQEMVATIVDRHRDTQQLAILGIANGGIPFSQKLSSSLSTQLKRTIPTGVLNIAFQRDDIGHNPIPKITAQTDIPFDVEQTTIILADDVLFSGRTVRAAINEIFDQGRPDQIELAILYDRGNRRLPIEANYTGFREDTTEAQTIRVTLNPEFPDQDSIHIFSA